MKKNWNWQCWLLSHSQTQVSNESNPKLAFFFISQTPNLRAVGLSCVNSYFTMPLEFLIFVTFVASHLCYGVGGGWLSYQVLGLLPLLLILPSPVTLMLLNNIFILLFYLSKSFKNFFVANRLESRSLFWTFLDLRVWPKLTFQHLFSTSLRPNPSYKWC